MAAPNGLRYAQVRESVVFGVDDVESFSKFPAHSILPPPYLIPDMSNPANKVGTLSAWLQEVKNCRDRQNDPTQRIFKYRPLLQLKTIERMNMSYNTPDEPFVYIRDACLVRKRLQMKALLSQYSLRQQFFIEKKSNRYFRLVHSNQIFQNSSSAMAMVELQFYEKQITRSDWFNLPQDRLKHFRDDYSLPFVDMTGGASGFCEYLAHRKKGKSIDAVGWDASAIDPHWTQRAFGAGLANPMLKHADATRGLHLFNPKHLPQLVQQVRTCASPKTHDVPFYFADGLSSLLHAQHVSPIIDSLSMLHPHNAPPPSASAKTDASHSASAAGAEEGLQKLKAMLSYVGVEIPSPESHGFTADSCQTFFSFTDRLQSSASSSSASSIAEEALRISEALYILQTRLAERALLSQVIIMLQTLCKDGSCIFKLENLESPFIASMVLLMNSIFKNVVLQKFKCSPLDLSCHLVCKVKLDCLEYVIQSLNSLAAQAAGCTSASTFGVQDDFTNTSDADDQSISFMVDMVRQSLQVIHAAYAFLNPVKYTMVSTEPSGSGSGSQTNKVSVILSPDGPATLSALLECVSALPPLPSLFETMQMRVVDNGNFQTLMEEFYDNLIAAHTQALYVQCRQADQPADHPGVDEEARRLVHDKFKAFELRVDASIAPPPPKQVPRRPQSGGSAVPEPASSSSATTASQRSDQSSHSQRDVSAPSRPPAQASSASSSASDSRSSLNPADLQPVPQPRFDRVNLNQTENPFFHALTLESARLGRIRAAEGISGDHDSSGYDSNLLRTPMPHPNSVRVENQLENPFLQSLLAESARLQHQKMITLGKQ